jgi:Flp pilus assembly protein TadG
MTARPIRTSGSRGARRARGQILVIFVIGLLAVIGATGLAIDAGSTFAQRRDQQVAADLAALAAANDWLINQSDDQAIARAQSVTTANGFADGIAGADIGVAIDTSNGVEVTVGVGAPHGNTFLRVLGMPTWQVSTSASALAGFPDSSYGAGPFIFSIGAFEDDGTPKFQTSIDFGEGNGDVPVSDLDFAWTNYGTGNVNTSQVRDIIDGTTTINKTLDYGEYIGQHNNGNHTALFSDVDSHLSGKEMPVAVVDSNGNFMGWAMFHVNSASGGSNKHINGYFLSSFISARLAVTACAANDCPRYLGAYVLKLSD